MWAAVKVEMLVSGQFLKKNKKNSDKSGLRCFPLYMIILFFFPSSLHFTHKSLKKLPASLFCGERFENLEV